MNSAKRKFWIVAIFWLLVPHGLFGVPFTATAPVNPGGSAVGDQQANVISQLKYQAVIDLMQKYLGSRFERFEKLLPKELADRFKFAEKYILDYRVGRQAANRGQLEINGNIDGDALKRWVRTTEMKNRGSSMLSPIFIISSSIPGAAINAPETAVRMRDSQLAQTALALANNALQKYSVRFAIANVASLPLREPPRNEDEIRALRTVGMQGGANTALWINFIPCKSCGGARMDTYFYNLGQGRVILTRTDDLAVNAAEMNNANRLRTVLKIGFNQFQNDFDEMVSSGTLFSFQYVVNVEGIDSYKAYKQVESEINQLDYISQTVMSRSEPHLAAFEVLTPLTIDELTQRLSQEPFTGFRLKLSKGDAKNINAKYVVQK